jgi:hypothetical protein
MRATLRWQHLLLQFPANIGMSDLPQAKYHKADHLTRLIHREGVDGNWSTFEIRVGTPANVFRVLPVTSWQETWVVWGSAAGHCNVSAGVSPDCGEARGGLFDNNTSSTWENGQEQFLGLNEALGYDGEGQYGMCAKAFLGGRMGSLLEQRR